MGDYLRVRIRKIEKHALHLLNSPDMIERLSDQEAQFVRAFAKLEGNHMKRAALKQIPKHFQKLTDQNDGIDMLTKPNLDTFVFCRVEKDVGQVSMDDEGEIAINLQRGDVLALRYRPIQGLIAS